MLIRYRILIFTLSLCENNKGSEASRARVDEENAAMGNVLIWENGRWWRLVPVDMDEGLVSVPSITTITTFGMTDVIAMLRRRVVYQAHSYRPLM